MAKISEDIKNLAVMAHDLKAPLSAVVNILSIIEKRYVDDPNKIVELVFRARKKTETLIKIVDDIVDYTLLETGENIKREKLDISNIIEESVSITRPYTKDKNISLDYRHKSCKKKYVRGNYTFLLRAFNNVIINAIKYNRKNGRIDIHCSENNNDAVNIEISDSGTGIAQEDLKNVFNIFSRGKLARENIEEGIGLGLALVKQIVKDHEGTINISSTSGAGTKVNIILPLF